jgi:pyruvate formate lyase activating enzyme
MELSIKGFIATSLVDWPGKISSVLFLAKCGFRCPACHNHRLVIDPDSLDDYPLDEILRQLKRRKGWIDGVTVTGGEPTAQRNLPQLLHLLKEHGMRVKLDTNGSSPGMLARVIESGLVDAIYMDVKAPLEAGYYSRAAGVPVNPAVIRKSIRILKASGLEAVFRTTVVPGLVEEPELKLIVEALGPVLRFVVQPFRNVETLNPNLRGVKEFSPDRFELMKSKFEIPAVTRVSPDRLAAVG